MNNEKFAKLFPLGSHLCREPMPAMSEMKKDMETLKKHGFNLIKLQEHWGIDEPSEGVYDFSKYEELIEYAQTLDMGIYLGLTCEQAPNWLYEKYPDCRMVGKNGVPVDYRPQYTLPGDGKPGPCYDHEGAMADQKRFITKLVEVLGKHENIVIWNTWQEIEYWAERLAGSTVCFCENTIAHFRKWLKTKYNSDLDLLNKAWRCRYSDWKYVEPDRSADRICLPSDMDWKYFMNHIHVGNILKERAAAIKEADPLKRPVFAHKSSPILGSGVDWTYARTQDFLGSSAYPAWGAGIWGDDPNVTKNDFLFKENWGGIALLFEYIRSANRRGAPVWAAEFQGGPVSTGFHYGRIPTKEDIRRWMLTSAAVGVSAISFWVTRAEIMAGELNGFGLLDSEGDNTERLTEAGRVGSALNKHADVFASPTLERAEVAILIDEDNYNTCMSMAQGGDNLVYSTRGWHRFLWDASVPMDFINANELSESYINDYKIIIHPFPLAISEKTAELLASFVNKGGNLISEASPGRINETGIANRGQLSPILRELFGITAKEFKMVREPNGEHRFTPVQRTWGEYHDETMLSGTGIMANKSLRANVYIQTFEAKDSEEILKFGNETAGVMKPSGKGKAWLFGTYIGHSGIAHINEETTLFVRDLIKQCGVIPNHDGKLTLRKRVTEKKEAWILINPLDKEITEKVNIGSAKKAETLYGHELSVNNGYVDLTIKNLDVEVLIVYK